MEHKRIKVIPKNPNPLFKKWLREWIEDAEKKKRRISKTYERALNSLNKYPLTLFSGHDCAILESFGPKICQMLDEKLEHHLSTRLDLFQQKCYKDKVSEVQRRESTRVSELVQNVEAACLADNTFGAATLDDIQEDVEMPEIPFQIDLSLKDDEFEVSTPPGDVEIPEELLSSSAESEDSFEKLLRKYDPEKATQKKFTKKISKGSGNAIKRQKIATTSIAIDLSMLPENSPIVPESYSPLSSVIKSGTRLKKFRTFDSGKSGRLAGPSYASSPISRFLDVEMTNQSPIPSSNFCNDSLDQLVAKYDFASPIPVVVKPSAPTAKLIKKPSLSKLRTINQVLKTAPSAIHEEAEDEMKYYSIDELNTQDFNVVLLVDIAETSGKSNASTDETLKKLKESNVKNEVRKLNVGDFLWIAQHKSDKTKELVLPYIIERKRLDDLSSSIKDGRFHEQKFRLKKCGIQNVVYLIENHMKAGKVQCSLPFTTLLQAATNTQIHSKFEVKFTENSQHTILYLTVMTTFIENIFKNKAPIKFQLIDFDKFNQAAVKQRKCTVRETFIKQLLALKGLSVDIALEITNNYATPTDLYEAFRSSSKTDGEALLSKITIGELKRKIPKTISKTIYHFYMCDKI